MVIHSILPIFSCCWLKIQSSALSMLAFLSLANLTKLSRTINWRQDYCRSLILSKLAGIQILVSASCLCLTPVLYSMNCWTSLEPYLLRMILMQSRQSTSSQSKWLLSVSWISLLNNPSVTLNACSLLVSVSIKRTRQYSASVWPLNLSNLRSILRQSSVFEEQTIMHLSVCEFTGMLMAWVAMNKRARVRMGTLIIMLIIRIRCVKTL